MRMRTALYFLLCMGCLFASANFVFAEKEDKGKEIPNVSFGKWNLKEGIDYQWPSKWLPIVSIRSKPQSQKFPRVAVGLIAAGDIPIGLFSAGGIPIGLVTAGGIGLGWYAAFGGIPISKYLSVGGITIGSHSFGAIAIGRFSVGAIAIGDTAYGIIAIGNHGFGLIPITRDALRKIADIF